MIKVTAHQEPTNFDQDVRLPGANLLSRRTPTSSKGFKNYWKKISHDLHRAYGGVCAYSCMYIMPPGSVDHFLPKVQYPQYAYEWNNYRLASPRLNQHKGDSEDIIDPFNIGNGWFVIDFPSCLVKPGVGLAQVVLQEVEKTIQNLKLNDDDTLVQERCDIMLELTEGNVTLDFLHRRYPFLAQEVIRQNIGGHLSAIFKMR